MKILVFSDSHRCVEPMTMAADLEKPDYIIHLGDLESDAVELNRRFYDIPLCSVPGNCDLMPFGQKRLIFDLAGKKFFVTHGHLYNVKSTYDALINTALTAGADVALFGHTHTPFEAVVAGLLVANPIP